MSPINDTFLSGSLDKTIRLWDLKSQNCQVCTKILLHLIDLWKKKNKKLYDEKLVRQ